MKSHLVHIVGLAAIWAFGSTSCGAQETPVESSTNSSKLPWIRVSEDGTHFVVGEKGKRFVIWGVNYDHDNDGRLLEDYWHDNWQTIVEDFHEIKELGANVVRIHLQLPKFMETERETNKRNLTRLSELVRLAEKTGLYLDLTGLGCYHKNDVPRWYDELDESARWEVQARFWRAIANVCKDSRRYFATT